MANVNLVYFSPAQSTRNIVQQAGKATGMSVVEHNITQGLSEPVAFAADDLTIIGVPVYAGRVPHVAAEALKKVKGQQSPAVVVCVYGNRDYDDALLELRDICTENGFNVISGAAFVARHSIFPAVAADRPDKKDRLLIKEFGERCAFEYQKYAKEQPSATLTLKGNRPYKTPGKIPLKPKANAKCTKCGTCAKQCPVNAIPADNPKKTDKTLCISCTRCMVVCPEKARGFKGLLYRIAGKKFTSKYSVPKEPETFFIS